VFRLECLALWEVIGFTSAAMHVALHGEEQTTEVPHADAVGATQDENEVTWNAALHTG